MKKLIAVCLMALCAVPALFGCGSGTKYVALEATDAGNEMYGYCVAKDASVNPKKDEILTAMNEVIAEFKESGLLDKMVEYHEAMSQDDGVKPEKNPYEAPALSGTETLVVYTNATFPPYEYVGANEKRVGVDMDVMTEVAHRLGMKMEVKDVEFNTIVASVSQNGGTGRYNVGAAGITITAERKESVDFSEPYYGAVQYIISAEGQSFTKIKDLAGLRIGVQATTTGDLLVDGAINKDPSEADKDNPLYGALKGTGAKVVQMQDGPTAFAALKNGTIDVIVIDKLPAQNIVANQ